MYLISYTIDGNSIPDEIILVLFDIVNMIPSIANVKSMDAVGLGLNTRDSSKPSTKCVLEGLQILLYYKNSFLMKSHILQTSGTARGALNCGSHFDIVINILN